MRTGGWRRALATVALVCHFFTAFGFPVPAPAAHNNGGALFPCQDNPCGCPTAEQCWAGDCCCFTLEEKLAWAEANGIEPPAHVRPTIEARKSRPAPALKRKKSCCSEDGSREAPAPAVVAPAPRSVEKSCCAREVKQPAAPDCPTCVPTAPAKACCDTPAEPSREDAPPAEKRSGVRWVAAFAAQKCRGEQPSGLLQLEPAVVPVLTPVALAAPEPLAHPAPHSDRTASTSHLPPTPPPRS
jgi:hypothetical protein